MTQPSTNNHDSVAARDDFTDLQEQDPEGPGLDVHPSRASIARALCVAVPVAGVGIALVLWFGGAGLALLALALTAAVVGPPIALVWLRANAHDRMFERAPDSIEFTRRRRLRGLLIGRSRRDLQKAEDTAAQQRQDDDGGPPEPAKRSNQAAGSESGASVGATPL